MSESSESSTTPETAPRNEEGTARERLAKLLSDEAPETAKGEADESHLNAEPPKGEPKGKPRVLKDLAETLKLEDKDLYAIEVPMAEGKTLSIGKMKDLAAKQDDFTVRELAFEERVAKQEAEWTRARTELDELMGMLDPKAIKPELKERARQKVDETNRREKGLVLKTIPEWANETVREADLHAMVEYLRDFGISDSFLTANVNHKLFRLVRDATLRKQRHERALANVELVRKPSTTGKSAAGNGAAKRPDVKPPASARVTARDRLDKALNS